MRIEIKSYSSKSSLINSIIFFIVGAILTAYADKIMTATYRIIGATFLIITIGIIISIIIRKKKAEPIYANRVAIAIVTLILAIPFFFFHRIIDETIRLMVGAWILFSGVTRLISAIRTDRKASRFFAILIVSILLIILGFTTIMTYGILPRVSGIIMMIYSAIEIIGYIFYSKDNVNYDDETDEARLLIPEKEEEPKDQKKKRKTKNIKDVEENDIEKK